MKFVTLIIACLMSLSAQATDFYFGNNSTNTQEWYGILESVKVSGPSVTMMVSIKEVSTERQNRFFVMVNRPSCESGYGPIYSRTSENQEWRLVTNFVVTDPSTVADIIGGKMCGVFKKKSI